MIQHHRGAVSMVKDLFGTYGAAQDETRVQVRLRRQRRSDHRDRPDGDDARRRSRPSSSHTRRDRSPRNLVQWPPLALRNALARRWARWSPSRLRHSTSIGRRAPLAGAGMSTTAPNPDPRVGLKAGLHERRRGGVEPAVALADAAVEGVRGRHQLRPRVHRQLRHPGQLQRLPGLGHLRTRPAQRSRRRTSARPRRATCRSTRICSSSRARGSSGRLDCGTEGVKDTVSKERLRGLRIFDITDIANPKNVGNVQTCRGSHTHTRARRSEGHGRTSTSTSRARRACARRASCRAASSATPDKDPELGALPHRSDQGAAGASGAGGDRQLAAHLQRPGGARRARRGAGGQRGRTRRRSPTRRRKGAFIVDDPRRGAWSCRRSSPTPMLDSIVKARSGTGAPTAADSAALRDGASRHHREDDRPSRRDSGPRPARRSATTSPSIPAIGLAGGACEGYGLLLDISDPAHPDAHRRRGRLELLLLALGDVQQRRHQDPVLRRVGRRRRSRSAARPTSSEWGADAIFTLADRKMQFQSYYKLPAPQTRAGELRRAQRLADPDSRAAT